MQPEKLLAVSESFNSLLLYFLILFKLMIARCRNLFSKFQKLNNANNTKSKTTTPKMRTEESQFVFVHSEETSESEKPPVGEWLWDKAALLRILHH